MHDAPNRRDFISTSIAAGVAASAITSFAEAQSQDGGGAREYYELRKYALRRGPMGQRIDGYMRDALIPAMQRAGVGPVGVFNVLVGPGNPTLYVLMVHRSAESVLGLGPKLAKDEEYHAVGGDFQKLPATDPPYVNLERSLMVAEPFMSRLEEPPRGNRILELRIYRSHNRAANRKKAEMFSPVGGELNIFRRVGLTPVFFADAIFGEELPNLTYMLTYPDLATREKNWATFVNDPEWKKLSATPGYTDPEIVASITNALLRPAAYSQI
jgi:hypothetical protein